MNFLEMVSKVKEGETLKTDFDNNEFRFDGLQILTMDGRPALLTMPLF